MQESVASAGVGWLLIVVA